jgi:DNA-binding response OmpR family regulator
MTENNMKKRMLIVEDEYYLGDMLRDWFRQRGFEPTLCENGIDGMNEALSNAYAVIILDVMLPGMDGFRVLEAVRKKEIHTPIVMLTARSELQDKLQGFHTGADDYVTKPFAVEELDARVNALLERVHDVSSERIRGAGMILDRNDRCLKNEKTGASVKLSGKEYTLAEFLLLNCGQLLSKAQITDAIWQNGKEPSYNNEEVYISFLRRKMKFIGAHACIETVRSEGYELKADHDS